MYHAHFRGTHYEAGFRWGSLLLKHKNIILENIPFEITQERIDYALCCLPIYEKYYHEIVEEIQGLADGQQCDVRILQAVLFSMYSMPPSCNCFSMPSGVCEPEERSPCMNKIDKLDKELEKAREKAAEWQAKIRELEKQKQEEENSQIVQAVRSLKLTPAQLMAFLNDPKNSLTASGHTDPKPEAPEKEDTAHEEN